MAELTPEAVAQLAALAGFRLAEGQVEKRAAQASRQAREMERVRRMPLGVVPPATPWVRPKEA
ncbi:MAG TPA: hypothetical protein VHL09_11415 [Dehalococcoidia bacterium]|nr:hypothetical protein [Dehalococcoidia bacterium]